MAHANPSDQELRQLLTDATTIAIVGASSNPDKESHGIMQKLQKAGYKVIPVNPRETEILGERSYPSLVDVPEREALAILLRNAGGYLTAARHDFEPGASVFDRIVIVATRAVGGSASQAAPEFALPPTSTASAAAEQQAVANESAEPIVYGPRPATVPVPGQPFTFVAPPQPARPGSSAIAAPVGSPLGGGGTARPGEVPVQQPPTRISPGPPRPKS